MVKLLVCAVAALWGILWVCLACCVCCDVSRSLESEVLKGANGYAFLALLLAITTYTQSVTFRIRDRLSEVDIDPAKVGELSIQLTGIVVLDSAFVALGIGTMWGLLLGDQTACNPTPRFLLIFGTLLSLLILMHAFSWFKLVKYYYRNASSSASGS